MIKLYGAKAFKPVLKGLIRDFRILWMLEELGVPYQHILLDPTKGENKKPDYLALNPFGKVPTLLDGDFALFESSAICTYLADKYEKMIPAPRTPERAQYDQWVAFAISTLEPSTGRVFQCDHFLEQNETTHQIRASAVGVLKNLLPVLDQLVKTKDNLVGEDFSAADLILTSVLRSIDGTPLLNEYASLSAYAQRNQARGAFVRAFAKSGGISESPAKDATA